MDNLADRDLVVTVLRTMTEGVYVVDTEGQLILMNAAAARMLGWTEHELRGRSMHEAIHYQRADGTHFPEHESQVTLVRGQGRTARVDDDAFTHRDGTIFPIAYSAAPLMNGTTVLGAVVVFRDATDEQVERARLRSELDALTWVGRIRDAIDEQRMVLYSQPIVALRDGAASEELLLRMLSRDGQVVLPGSFLPAAEKYGLIEQVDHWVVKQAVGLAAAGRRLECNLSASSIGNPELLRLIEHELRETGADPADVVFEITETALMNDIQSGVAFAHELVEMGCGLALDDFGTGFGGFTYLKRIPFKYLKIDVDFVRRLASTSANQHLVKAIVTLAAGFELETIAEGVEDDETLELLHAYGVDYAQGFHVGQPAPIALG